MDWMLAFYSIGVDPATDFSMIACAWSLLKKNSLQHLTQNKGTAK